jgi:hypothetical protein
MVPSPPRQAVQRTLLAQSPRLTTTTEASYRVAQTNPSDPLLVSPRRLAPLSDWAAPVSARAGPVVAPNKNLLLPRTPYYGRAVKEKGGFISARRSLAAEAAKAVAGRLDGQDQIDRKQDFFGVRWAPMQRNFFSSLSRPDKDAFR